VEEAEKEGGVHEAAVKTKHKTKAAITGLFQKTGKKLAGFRGDVVVDGARKQVRYRYRFANILADGLATSEKIGSKVDKLLFQGFSKDDGSIDHYPAKLDGHHGYIVIEPANDDLVQPHVAFVPNSGKSEEFVLPIDDIVEIKKVSHPLHTAPSEELMAVTRLYDPNRTRMGQWSRCRRTRLDASVQRCRTANCRVGRSGQGRR